MVGEVGEGELNAMIDLQTKKTFRSRTVLGRAVVFRIVQGRQMT